MRPLIVKQLDYDLTPVAGLALVGHYLNALRPVFARLDAALPIKAGVANGDIVRVRIQPPPERSADTAMPSDARVSRELSLVSC